MNKSTYLLGVAAFFMVALFSSCMKDVDEGFHFKDPLVEFDLATTTSNAPGKNYPLLPALSPNSGVTQYRINLLGEQLSENQNVAFRVVADESTAVEGEHYNLPNGHVVLLPANDSFGYLEIDVLDFELSSGTVQVVFELIGNDIVSPSENHKSIGVRIDLE